MHMYSKFLNKIILPLGDLIFGGGYLKALKEWNEYDQLSKKELIELQNERLEKTLKYTINNVPFYNNIKYNPELSAIENLKSFPILTKEILRNSTNNLISKEFDTK